jgi:hypothetical protein
MRFLARSAMASLGRPKGCSCHLPQSEAKALLDLVLDEYRRKHDRHDPQELFLHSTYRFNEQEWAGFKSVCPENTRLCAIRIVDGHRDLKLYRAGNYPVLRGTAVMLSPRSGLLWTTGYIPDLRTYPGMETPNPIHIEVSQGEIGLQCAVEGQRGPNSG